MKKRIILAGLSMALCMLCGCLEATPLTDAEMDVVAEYAATMLLKNDDKYSTPLYYVGVIPEEELEEKLTPTPTPTAAPIITQKPSGNNTNNSGNGEVKATPTPTPGLYNSEETKKQLNEIIAVENISISCEGFEIMDSVVSNDYFSLNAKEGRTYVVIQFKLKNNTTEELIFDASEKGLEYTLDINTGTISKVSLSMLQNDLQYMPIKVSANGEAEAVLVFEIADELIDTAHLIIEKNDDEAVFIKLK